jgi:hypothetical protein
VNIYYFFLKIYKLKKKKKECWKVWGCTALCSETALSLLVLVELKLHHPPESQISAATSS